MCVCVYSLLGLNTRKKFYHRFDWIGVFCSFLNSHYLELLELTWLEHKIQSSAITIYCAVTHLYMWMRQFLFYNEWKQQLPFVAYMFLIRNCWRYMILDIAKELRSISREIECKKKTDYPQSMAHKKVLLLDIGRKKSACFHYCYLSAVVVLFGRRYTHLEQNFISIHLNGRNSENEWRIGSSECIYQ